MKIYTKTGDNGTTSLIGGSRVPKYHKRIEAYGTIDELMAFTGMLHDQIENKAHKTILIEVQDRLMTCATLLAADSENSEFKLPALYDSDIEFLEKEIDKLQDSLPRLTHFILPGGHATTSWCHIARTVCRRAERLTILVNEDDKNADKVVKYLNRLSDYFFVLARKLTIELNCEEITWTPRS